MYPALISEGTGRHMIDEMSGCQNSFYPETCRNIRLKQERMGYVKQVSVFTFSDPVLLGRVDI